MAADNDGHSSVGRQTLRIGVLEVEENPPDRGNYLHLTADVESNGFCGSGSFWVSTRDIAEFVDQMEEFDRKLSGEAHLRCGWGDEVLFGIEFLAYDRMGHIGVRVRLASDVAGRGDTKHELRVEFEVDPMQLKPFVTGMGSLGIGGDQAAVLQGL